MFSYFCLINGSERNSSSNFHCQQMENIWVTNTKVIFYNSSAGKECKEVKMYGKSLSAFIKEYQTGSTRQINLV